MSETPLSTSDLARWRQLLDAWEHSACPSIRCAGCQTDLFQQPAWRFCGGCCLPYCLSCLCISSCQKTSPDPPS
jgi:hypothetical protein